MSHRVAIADRHVAALSAVFGTSPEVIRGVAIKEHSPFARLHRAWAVTRANAIYLRGPASEFFSDPESILHEYYHVLRQWNTGELSALRYVKEWIRCGCKYRHIAYEVQAREFAAKHAGRYWSLCSA